MKILTTIASLSLLLAACGQNSEKERDDSVDTIAADPIDAGGTERASQAPTEVITNYALTFERAQELFGSEGSMMERFGRENVVPGEIHLGEGESVPATILFPDDPERRLKISWHNNLDGSDIDRIVIEETPSKWYLEPGLTTGVKLDSLRAMNGQSIRMMGFEWDYSGTIMDLYGGVIDKLQSDSTWLSFSANPSQNDVERVGAEKFEGLIGDRYIDTTNPLLMELNPAVDRITMIFAHTGVGHDETDE